MKKSQLRFDLDSSSSILEPDIFIQLGIGSKGISVNGSSSSSITSKNKSEFGIISDFYSYVDLVPIL